MAQTTGHDGHMAGLQALHALLYTVRRFLYLQIVFDYNLKDRSFTIGKLLKAHLHCLSVCISLQNVSVLCKWCSFVRIYDSFF